MSRIRRTRRKINARNNGRHNGRHRRTMKGGWQSSEKKEIKRILDIKSDTPDTYDPKPRSRDSSGDIADQSALYRYYDRLVEIYNLYWHNPAVRQALEQEFTRPKQWKLFSKERGQGRNVVYNTLIFDLNRIVKYQEKNPGKVSLDDMLREKEFGYVTLGNSAVDAAAATSVRLPPPVTPRKPSAAASLAPAAALSSAPVAAAAALSSAGVGDQWTEHIDPETEKPYYYNNVTTETKWEKPPGFISAAPADDDDDGAAAALAASAALSDDGAGAGVVSAAPGAAAGVGAVSIKSHIPPRRIFQGPFATGVAMTFGAKALRPVGHILDDKITRRHLAAALGSQEFKCPLGPTFFETDLTNGARSVCKNCGERLQFHEGYPPVESTSGGTKSRHRRRGANNKSRKVRKSRPRRHHHSRPR